MESPNFKTSNINIVGYKAQRDFLDNKTFIKKNPLNSNPRRGKTGPHYFKTIISSLFNNSNGLYVKPSEVKQYRKELKIMFPNVNKIMNTRKYNGVDQGEEGACSFVGFLNLTILSGNKKIFRPKDIHKSWIKIWESFEIDTAADIGEVLDKILDSNLLKKNVEITKLINYIPVRSEKNREMSFNKSFWIEPSIILDKFGISLEIYNQVPWVYQNAYLIESLIDSYIPVLINGLEHTRTCVGYNDKYLLFADNWIETYEQTSDNGTEDYFKAGFSVINKWAIYSWLRDMVYYKKKDS
jgi:hypothetical protein